MIDILIRAGCFIGIILLGYLLKKVGYFKESDFDVLSKITVRITLPAAIISSMAGREISLDMLVIPLIALLGGILYMAVGFAINLKNSRAQRAFDVLNLPGYNIGNFTLPFVQSFLGPVGVLTTSLFDVGNVVICIGGAYSIASMIKYGRGFSLKLLGKALITSVPLMCHLIMVTLNLLGVTLPTPVLSFAEIIGAANPFIAMLMIGIGFKLSANRTQLGAVARILLLRYGIAAILAVCCYYLLPFPAEMRITLAVLLFSPIGSVVPAFTSELKEDVGLSSAINSISIICSLVIMVTLLTVMLP